MVILMHTEDFAPAALREGKVLKSDTPPLMNARSSCSVTDLSFMYVTIFYVT